MPDAYRIRRWFTGGHLGSGSQRFAQRSITTCTCHPLPLTPNDLRLLILLVFTHVVVEVEGKAVFSGQSANVRHVDVANKSTIFLLQAEAFAYFSNGVKRQR